jgi:hypothetical protein
MGIGQGARLLAGCAVVIAAMSVPSIPGTFDFAVLPAPGWHRRGYRGTGPMAEIPLRTVVLGERPRAFAGDPTISRAADR